MVACERGIRFGIFVEGYPRGCTRTRAGVRIPKRIPAKSDKGWSTVTTVGLFARAEVTVRRTLLTYA
jgi:hypothetical protein